MSVQGTVNYYGGDLQTSLIVDGTLNYWSTIPVQFSGNLTISSIGTCNHMGSGPLRLYPTSFVVNYGLYNATIMNIAGSFININTVIISGQNATSHLTQFVALPNSTFSLMNSHLVVDSSLSVGAGSFYASGIITTPQFLFDSQDGFFRLISPFSLKIIGDATFSNRCF
jgi:hypothetical protein